MALLCPSGRLAVAATVGVFLAGAGIQGVRPAVAQPGGQQAPAATFRTQVNVVEVDAVVMDQQGRFVPDLRQEDFQVFEDGRRQKLASLRMVNIPVERVETPLFTLKPAEPDVQSNAHPFAGRLYIIVLDDLQTSANRTNIARRLARDFIAQNVAPNDLAAVVTTSGSRKSSQDFTNDGRLLLAAVDQLVGRKVMPPGLAGLSQEGTPEASSPEAAAPQRIANARTSLQTLTSLAAFAGTIRNHRKAMVLVGEGIDYDLGKMGKMQAANGADLGFVNEDNATRELRDWLKDFIDAANRANVTMYAFDPRVYTHGGDDFVDIASGPPGDMEKGDELIKTAKLQDDLMASQDNLRAMATETGGFAVTGSPKALATAFDRVRTENSNYYILGYYPANEARDGRFRKIDVRVNRTGLKVEARKGYVAPRRNPPAAAFVEAKEGTSPEVRDVLANALPMSGFTLRAAAAAFKGTAPNASVVITVQTDGNQLKFTPKGDRFEDSVELSVVAIDKQGKTRGGERMKLDMPLSEKMRAFVADAGLVFQLRVNLPPGPYELRIAGRDAGTERVGSVHYDIEVPDFLAAPLSMSGIVLTAEQAGQVPNPRPDEELRALLPATPITTRAFAGLDELTALVEVYDNRPADPHSVRIAATVQGDDGRVAFRQEEQRNRSDLDAARGAYGYTVKIPLREVGPGSYVLRVEARSSLSADLVAMREVQFTVR